MLSALPQVVWGVCRTIKHDVYNKAHYTLRQQRTAVSSSALSPMQTAIVKNLRNQGYAVSSLSELGLSSNALLKDALEATVPKLNEAAESLAGKPYAASLTEEQVMDSGLLQWGLDETLLHLAENYLGLPVSYRGVLARREKLDGLEVESRLWHRDPEDWQILKVIVYLNSVDDDGGPFECIPRNYTPRLDWYPKDRKGRILNNQNLEKLKVSMVGGPGTVIFTDTCRVYHRGKIGTRTSRMALFYCYNAQNPSVPEVCKPLFSQKEFLSRYGKELTPRQIASLGSDA